MRCVIANNNASDPTGRLHEEHHVIKEHGGIHNGVITPPSNKVAVADHEVTENTKVDATPAHVDINSPE